MDSYKCSYALRFFAIRELRRDALRQGRGHCMQLTLNEQKPQVSVLLGLFRP